MGTSTGEIAVNQGVVSSYSGGYNDAASYLSANMDIDLDSKSTISAKTNSYNAYMIGEALLENLGVHLDTEASVIRSTGLTFEQYDEMVAGFIANGYREPTFVQG